MQSSVVWWWAVWCLWALGWAGRAGACSSSISKRPARPARPRAQPQPQPQPRLNVTFPTFKCEPKYSEYYCLNGGVCFTVVISDSPIYNCECRTGFVGQRCEFKDLDDSYVLTSRQLMMETASIAGGATVAVFLAILVCFGAWVRLHRRNKAPPFQEERGPSPVQLLAVAPAPAHRPISVSNWQLRQQYGVSERRGRIGGGERGPFSVSGSIIFMNTQRTGPPPASHA
ncbi:hypothetical protein K1T71_010522 [Dendrolimus kikuchii]|uniref:Uncharacterized protein n=1 Tax=Dendrolimus kikuchii TaxID=765133 RepID=A0ACC1CRU5_9NEOP|nr:hypothetical protein K1T71_010522 [Dendrolimus kikuchii]